MHDQLEKCFREVSVAYFDGELNQSSSRSDSNLNAADAYSTFCFRNSRANSFLYGYEAHWIHYPPEGMISWLLFELKMRRGIMERFQNPRKWLLNKLTQNFPVYHYFADSLVIESIVGGRLHFWRADGSLYPHINPASDDSIMIRFIVSPYLFERSMKSFSRPQ